ncbi:MAG TPA: PIG-L family deacetylase [Kineosporiaceae bacterium]
MSEAIRTDTSDAAAHEEAPPPGGVVVLSPHLDDAVLSLGALIARLTAGGRPVQVWTAFSHAPPGLRVPRRWQAFGDYATRRAEDARALAVVGARPRHLGLPERIWRRPQPRTLAGAFRGPASMTGFACLPAVADAVASALRVPGVEVYAPLGVGQHADHLEVAVAALSTALDAQACGRVGFYEDYYALSEASRRRHPVARLRPFPGPSSPGWAAPTLGAALWLMAAALPGPRLDRYLPVTGTLRWACEPVPVDGFESRKLTAVAAYASQLPRLGGRRRLEAALRRAHRSRGGELVWRAQPARR